MILQQYHDEWKDEAAYHVHINDLFRQLVDLNPNLKEHRDWVEKNIFGFGERSFWWLWKLICDELPDDAKMCEIGIFKGATISLWQRLKPYAEVWGVSPMNGDGTGWTEDDYWAHLNNIYEKFNNDLPPALFPIIMEGYSESPEMIAAAGRREYDCIYVDGGHSYETALSDLTNYSTMIKAGGFLVIDDCNNDLNFPPTGYFCGIEDVTKAKKAWLATNPPFEFIFSVVHISVFKRV